MLGGFLPNLSSEKNAARSAHRCVGRWGLSWKVPFTYSNIAPRDHPSEVVVPWLSPKAWLKFLLGSHPELLLGGHSDLQIGGDNLRSFWRCYKQAHPEHQYFAQANHEATFSRTIPVSLHGDEGRSQKKGHVFVAMLESNLGLENLERKRRLDGPEPWAKRCCRGSACGGDAGRQHDRAPLQVTNLKGHSFLSRHVLCALPTKVIRPSDDEDTGDEALLNMLSLIYAELRELATCGITVCGEKWHCQVTGMKGDLDFFRKAACLRRHWKRQLGVNVPMCHECHAGHVAAPFEDVTQGARWKDTLWYERPWDENSAPDLTQLVFQADAPERILRRDLFHNTKVGIFRDYIGGAVTLLMRLGYFNIHGESNARKLLLQRAHASFRLWCIANNEAPGLRSFSEQFFNLSSWSSFAWVNCKGSDATLLLRWLDTQVCAFMNEVIDDNHLETLRLLREGARCAMDFTLHTYLHGLWMRKACASRLCSDMKRFMKIYHCLASWSRTKHNYTAFGLKSKLHMLCHTHHDLEVWTRDPRVERVLNPQVWGCESNEDTIGRVARISRRVAHKQGPKRTLELYLIKCKAVHRRYKKSLKIRR